MWVIDWRFIINMKSLYIYFGDSGSETNSACVDMGGVGS